MVSRGRSLVFPRLGRLYIFKRFPIFTPAACSVMNRVCNSGGLRRGGAGEKSGSIYNEYRIDSRTTVSAPVAESLSRAAWGGRRDTECPPNLPIALHKRSGGRGRRAERARFQPAIRLLYYDLLGLICLRCCLFRNRDCQDAVFGLGLDLILFHVVRKEHRLLELGV